MANAIRTWKRNGDRNVMSEEAAIANLAQNGRDYPRDMPRDQVRADAQARLRAGENVHTLHAFFRLAA